MRKVFLILVFFYISLFAYSQKEWAPVGARWFNSMHSMTSPDQWYSKIEVLKDTTINGLLCKALLKEGNYCDFLPNQVYIYQEGEKIFYFNKSLDTLNLLYDFTKLPGESWVLKYSTNFSKDSIRIKVDSIKNEVFNFDTLRVMYITQIPFSTFTNISFAVKRKIVEKIGALDYFFPESGTCDPIVGELRCYSDNVIGEYETGAAISCDFVSSDINQIEMISPKIFPNPSSGIFYIQSSFPDIFSIDIYNVLGENLISTCESNENGLITINLSSQPRGLYFIRLKTATEVFLSNVLVVH